MTSTVTRHPSDDSLLKNTEAGYCRFCCMRVQRGQGVLLQECFHLYCRECLQFAIQMQTESLEIPCPVWYLVNCGGFLTDSEVKQLVSPEIYLEYVDRSLIVAKKKMRNVFSCKTDGCRGWCEYESGRKTFVCPICGQINCMKCNVIHSYSASCENYKKPTSSSNYHAVSKEIKNGWSQLVELVKSSGDYKIIEKTDLLANTTDFECSICFADISTGSGVILHECLHMFCRECLIRLVECNDEVTVKCPYVDENQNCQYFLQPREIKALVPEHIYEKHLQRSVKLGESSCENSFHCKTPDCPGWCVYDEGVTKFKCPICRKRNCIACKAIHEGMFCSDFRNQMNE